MVNVQTGVVMTAYAGGVAVAGTPDSSAEFVYNLGSLGIALACIYWMLGRGDRREEKAAKEAREQLIAEQIKREQAQEASIKLLKEQIELLKTQVGTPHD